MEENDKDKIDRQINQRTSVRSNTRKNTADEDDWIKENKIDWTHNLT